MSKKYFLYSILCGLISFGFHQNLSADDAAVLPKNRWRLRLMTIYSESENKYDSEGAISSLGSQFSRNIDVRFARAMDPQPQLNEFVQKKNSIVAGSGDAFLQESIAALSTKIESNLVVNTMVAEYGLTDRLSLGIILPVIYGSTDVSAESNSNSDFQQKIKSAPGTVTTNPEKAVRSGLLSATSIKSINSLLTQKYGYSDGLTAWSGWGLGDLEVGAKYNYFRTHPFRATLKSGFRAPTGRQDDPNKLMDLAFGDGQWDLGFFHLLDIAVLSNLSLTWETGYTYQIESEVDARVPISEDLPIGPTVGTFERKLGDYWETAFELNIKPIKELTLSPRYRFRQKFKDEYEGANGVDTALLEKNTNSILHEGSFQVEYTNLPSVRAGLQKFPYAVSASYRMALAGENQTDFRVGGIQLKTYF